MIPHQEYSIGTLDAADLAESPVEQLRKWLDEARGAGVVEPTSMCLSTVGGGGRPSSRFVLLRGLDERGLAFFTNYESRKGVELATNPYGASAFWWGALERQVRVEGRIERTSGQESDEYFSSRPPKSRLAAAVSPQSQVLDSREELEGRLAELQRQYPDGNVPRPGFWGGFRLIPDRFEFWQGRRARLHDRLVFTQAGDGWQVTRLAP